MNVLQYLSEVVYLWWLITSTGRTDFTKADACIFDFLMLLVSSPGARHAAGPSMLYLQTILTVLIVAVDYCTVLGCCLG